MDDLFSYIISQALQRRLFSLKFLFLSISLFLGGLIFYLLRKTGWLSYRFTQDLVEFAAFKPLEAIGFEKKWQRIKKRMRKGWEAEAKLAIIEADNLLDELLKRMGYVGESLGERLKQLDEKVLPNINRVWDAHKIRNNIVHDPDYRLSFDRAREIIQIYEEAFKNLEAL